MKPWKQGRHGARLKDWLLTEPGGGLSRMLYTPEGATGIKEEACYLPTMYFGTLRAHTYYVAYN
jgi:hypothetical protein